MGIELALPVGLDLDAHTHSRIKPWGQPICSSIKSNIWPAKRCIYDFSKWTICRAVFNTLMLVIPGLHMAPQAMKVGVNSVYSDSH